MGFRERSKDVFRDVLIGASIFGAMSYILVANPLILSGQAFNEKTGMSASAVYFATCASAGFGSLLMALFARTPTAVAPAMGLNIFFAQTVLWGGLDWRVALLATSVASFVVLMMCLTPEGESLRQRFLNALPDPIKYAISTSIGAVLIDASLKFVGDRWEYLLFLPGLAILYLFKTIGDRGHPLVGAFGIVLSIAAISVVCWALGLQSVYTAPIHLDKLWVWEGETGGILDQLTFTNVASGFVLAFVTFYVLLADYVGTAANKNLVPKLADDAKERHVVRRALTVESSTTLLSTILGTSPTLCYAENIAGKHVADASGARPYSPDRINIPVAVVGLCFVFFLGLGYVAYLNSASVENYIPRIAVAPALFFIGVSVLASSLYDQAQSKPIDDGLKNAQELDWIPAAISITLVPIAGFEYALGFGALSYYVLHFAAGNSALLRDGPFYFFVIFFSIVMLVRASLPAPEPGTCPRGQTMQCVPVERSPAGPTP